MDTFLHIGTKDTLYGGNKVRIGLKDRRQHCYITGKSGTGKSHFLATLFSQEANHGRGCLVIDPHGDLAEQCLDLVPPTRIRKTLYFNPDDVDFPISFNPLAGVKTEHRAIRAIEIVGAFKSIWADSWGPRLEHILFHTLMALLEAGNTTLLSIPQMLLNKSYRAKIIKTINDPICAGFWADEFPSLDKKFGMEAISPVLNKIGQLLSSPALRAILGQPTSAFDPRHLMDNNYLVIINLSKGRIGAQHANLLGSLLVASFGTAAMSRADLAPDDRKDFACIVDEFHNYTTHAFAYMLAEVRKYKLSLILANQYLEQMSDPIRAAVLGNVGSLLVFRTGAEDAARLARNLHPLRPEQLTETPNRQAWASVLQYGHPSEVFLLTTPSPPKIHGRASTIVKVSRNHFASSRVIVEKRIARFLDPEQARASLQPTEWW
jgi:hypothetical protein